VKKKGNKFVPVPNSTGVRKFVSNVGRFAHKHRRELVEIGTFAIEVGLILAPVPGGKVYGAARVARGLGFLGFGRLGRGLAIAVGTPILAGIAAEKLGDSENGK